VKVKALKGDVEEMQTMLEAYMNFARGAGGEKAEASNIADMIAGAAKTGARAHSKVEIDVAQDLVAKVKPNAFRRLIVNLVANAARYGEIVAITARAKHKRLRILVDDNGPGIPANMREDVFRPFFRLDEARNQDEGGTGLGLAIARDIARSHGGDIKLEESPFGGLRAVVEIPV
jgi:two-component system osmolarity sensor histidine kinase EnvZ